MTHLLTPSLFSLQQNLLEKGKEAPASLTTATDIDIWPAFFNMVIVLTLVVAFIFLLSWLFKKIAGNSASFGGAGFMKVLSTLPLGDRRVLTVVKVGTRFFLVGISQNSINNLAELGEEDVKGILHGENPADGSFAKILRKMTGREEEKSQ